MKTIILFLLLAFTSTYGQEYQMRIIPVGSKQDTIYLITFKRVTVVPQSCPEGISCAVFHFKEDVSDEMIKIFYEEADADDWIKENENDWMNRAIDIRKEKMVKQ